MGSVTKVISQGFAYGDLAVLMTPADRLISLFGREHERLLETYEQDDPHDQNVFILSKLNHDVEQWCSQNMKGLVTVRPGMSNCRLSFEKVEDAALFKLFWL
jgi:hypothetical protein